MDPRKERIFEAAFKVYVQFGFQKANVQEIADAAGVSKKTLYNHFDGKEDLFFSTIQWYVESILEFYDRLVTDETLSTPEKLIEAINYASREISYKHSMMKSDLSRMNPYLEESPLRYVRRNIQRVIRALIIKAREEGLCRMDLSTESIALVIDTIINGLMSWDAADQLQIPMPELFDTTMNLLLSSLLTDKGRSLVPVDQITHQNIQ